MKEILSNISSLWPIFVIPWVAVIIFTVSKPQRYMNSVLLMIACMGTLFFACGLFGKYMNTAFLAAFCLVILVLFSVPVLLIANGIILIKRESFTIPHLLSIILGIGIGAGEAASIVFLCGTLGYLDENRLHIPSLLITATVFYFSCLMLNFVAYTVLIQILPHRMKFDYIIIHGCGLANGNKITKLLSNRVDKAIEIYVKCRKKPILIPSGGKGTDELISEAEAMREYLLSHGIPESHIIMEDKSTTTMENLINSKKIIEQSSGKKRVALVSSNYHIYRALTYAKRAKLNCVGIGSSVALYFWPSALIREFIAVFTTVKFLAWSIIGYLLFVSPVLILIFANKT